MYEFHGACWIRLASWRGFSGFRVSGTSYSTSWRVYLATGFDFREKNRAGLGSIGDTTPLPTSHLVSLLSTDGERVNFPETSYLY